MPTEKQVSTLREYVTAVARSADRRDKWSKTADQIANVLGNRVNELKTATGFGLELRQHGVHNERAIQLGFGKRIVFQAADRTLSETGAILLITLAVDGFVQFVFIPTEVEQNLARQHTNAVLGRFDPAEAVGKVDEMLELFLTRAVETHWSTQR